MHGVDLGRSVSCALGSDCCLNEALLDRDDVIRAHLPRRFVALAKFYRARRNQTLALTFSTGMRELDGHGDALFDALFDEPGVCLLLFVVP